MGLDGITIETHVVKGIWVFQHYRNNQGSLGKVPGFILPLLQELIFHKLRKKKERKKKSVINFTSPFSPSNLHWDWP